VLPRPELSDLLGIAYRRIPVLAIGNDVYCDTSLISSALERRFPPSAGYGSIFPPRKASGSSDEWIIQSFSRQYAEGTLFPLAMNLLKWENFPSSFLADRSSVCFVIFMYICYYDVDPRTLK
jgi:glutathione S-transferase